jgi:xanthine phosphoribosyltransferase
MKHLKLSNTDVRGYVAKICRDITNSGWRPDYIVGLVRGGMTPAVMISQYFDIPMWGLKVSLRNDGETESNCWMAEDAFGHIDYDPMASGDGKKKILIVDDINDSGATINWIIEDWQSMCLPDDERWDFVWNANVRFATVVNNLASKCKVNIDYVGLEVNKAEEDVWIDFPWEIWWTE